MRKIIILVGVLGCVLLIGWFYWYEVRPVKIRSKCSYLATEKATLRKDGEALPSDANALERLKHRDKDILNSEEYEIYYNICLNEKGLR